MSAKQTKSHQTLRRRAEKLVASGAAVTQKIESLDEANRLLHDLQVHQVELELQNEELRRAQAELDATRARYVDLYDMASVGFGTLSEQGLILDANLTAATLLGVGRGALVNQRISLFVLPEDQDLYYRHRKQLFETGEPQACDLRMVKKDGTSFWAHLASTAVQDPSAGSGQAADGATVCRVVLSNISERKQAEEALRQLHNELEERVAAQTEELRQANEKLRAEITDRRRVEAEREALQVQNRQLQTSDSPGRMAGAIPHHPTTNGGARP